MATVRERQREVQLYRGQIPSPGQPTVAWISLMISSSHPCRTDRAEGGRQSQP